MNELKEMYKEFIKDLELYKNMGDNEIDKLKYLFKVGYLSEDDYKDDYRKYVKEELEEAYDYEEWLEEQADSGTDNYDDIIKEHNQPLEINTYKEVGGDYMKWDIAITLGGPNIRLELDNRWNNANYGSYWGTDKYEADLSYYYDTLLDMYGLDY